MNYIQLATISVFCIVADIPALSSTMFCPFSFGESVFVVDVVFVVVLVVVVIVVAVGVLSMAVVAVAIVSSESVSF